MLDDVVCLIYVEWYVVFVTHSRRDHSARTKLFSVCTGGGVTEPVYARVCERLNAADTDYNEREFNSSVLQIAVCASYEQAHQCVNASMEKRALLRFRLFVFG